MSHQRQENDGHRDGKYVFESHSLSALKAEFQTMLTDGMTSRIETHSLAEYHSSGSTSSSSLSTSCELLQDDHTPSKESINALRSIADRMFSAGHVDDCIQVYASARKSFMDMIFQRLGIDKLSTVDVKRMEWQSLEREIQQWIQAASACVQVLFPREKQLCEQIFEGQEAGLDDACFFETVKDHAILLFNFAGVVSVGRKSMEKLFKILDLYDALSGFWPNISVVFKSESMVSIRVQVSDTLTQLEEAVRGILSEFENTVLGERTIPVVGDQPISTMTIYVMKCMTLMISKYKLTLFKLIVSKPELKQDGGDLMMMSDIELMENEGRTPLAIHLAWIIVALRNNLAGKSKHYADASLAHVFMMNNVHYIVQKINESLELREMVGEHLLEKLRGQIQQDASKYEISTWNRVMQILDTTELVRAGNWKFSFKRDDKAKLKKFYVMFEGAHQTQAIWLVPDPHLQEELRKSILKKLTPTYKSFLDEFRRLHGIDSEKYIKYSIEDLERFVFDFFRGRQVSKQLTRSQQN
ncbi:exocyst complex component EXO70A1-like [Cornus florida]|uniref:exocyst complex component EXO70A1-like n=1 Tax=Cornus florida TaxID=4283 RepID=UPI00289A25C1|nr:exocyst complex component EXO70A1-like [Cornus florida]